MACVEDAINVYLQRASRETRPMIVRLVSEDGDPLSHWYYRSQETVFTTPFRSDNIDIPAYDGPLSEMPNEIRKHFEADRFEFAYEESRLALDLEIQGHTSCRL